MNQLFDDKKSEFDQTTRIISGSRASLKTPAVCLWLDESEFNEVRKFIKIAIQKRHSAARSKRSKSSSDKPEPQIRPFSLRVDPFFTDLHPYGGSIKLVDKDINKTHMLDYLNKCMLYYITTPSLHPQETTVQNNIV